MRQFQLHQFKFENHQTHLHPRNQDCQRQRHLHWIHFLHLPEFQAFQCYQGFDFHRTSASPRIAHFHLTYNHS